MKDIVEILKRAVELETADVFIVAGIPVSFKIHNTINHSEGEKLLPSDTEKLILQMYELAGNRDPKLLTERGDDDFSFSITGLSRFRVNTYKQRGSLAAVIRIIRFELPDYKKLNIPENVMSIADKTGGFVLVTGPAASGKSMTLACIIDAINEKRNSHIITLEDPIEYLHRHKNSIVSQRELEMDTASFVGALRAAMRQSPDVILVGEMRDFETIRTAVTAAETGHMIISTLHTVGAANSIDRIIDAFPVDQQQQIRVQLSMVLSAVISQQLIPTVDGKVIPAFEVMFVNSAIRNLIRESKIHQIDNVIMTSAKENMISMDTSILKLYTDGKISYDNAVKHSVNPVQMIKKIEMMR
ncbi:type IV pili twitching motility protein PilT [Tyzzerella sp. An114]|uniref:type IV pilus twitching motility protein PilT n=1 Tax=Tyzzerella sp. An114 TaxID=1965545 RepID=UPI000B4551E8|nr:PilT/PilU family type 4a pilus ATPase [Tyzzerella sp. An114]OUQ57421.1 type IV pili twitching motility protein PilT [Tyzzerella sp. An114]